MMARHLRPPFGAVLSAVVMASCCGLGPASAFDCTGHMIVAKVAFQQVDPSVMSSIQPIFEAMALRYPTMSDAAEMACFPDDMKSWTSVYSNWHYYDQCYAPDGTPCPAVPDGILPRALAAARTNLANTSLSNVDRAFWLAFVLHLVGDAHQPLHFCTLYSQTFPDGDLGGNRFVVKLSSGGTVGLHELQDDAVDDLIPEPYLSRPAARYPAELRHLDAAAQQLRLNYTFPPSIGGNLTLDLWMSEALSLCKSTTYLNGTLQNGSSVSQAYVNNIQQMIRRQVALAGMRLAYILNDAIGGAGSSGDDSRNRAIAFGVVGAIGAVVLTTLTAACVKNHCGRRRRHHELLLDMPYEGQVRGGGSYS